jgi:hypothetical protein
MSARIRSATEQVAGPPGSGAAWRERFAIRSLAPAGGRLSVVIGMALVGIVTFAFRWLSLTSITNDHFDHVARAYQLRLGDWPVRDFVDPGLPLTYLLSAAIHAIVGHPFLAETVLFVSGFALAAALSFRLAVLASGSASIAVVATALQVAAYPRSYGYPKLVVYALAVTAAWWAVDRPSPRGDGSGQPQDLTVARLAALAAATAVAYYFRHDHGVYVGIAMVVLLVMHLWHHGAVRVARALALYAGLTLAFVLPHLAYVQWQIGLRSYFAVALEYSRMETRINPYQLPGFTWPLTAENSVPLLFWACWLIPVLAAAALARGRVATPLQNQTPKVAMLVAVAVCVNLGLLRDPLLVRLPDVAMPHSVLGAWLLAALWRWPATGVGRAATRTALSAITVVIALAVFSAFETSEKWQQTEFEDGLGAMTDRWVDVSTDLQRNFPSVLSSATEPLIPFFDYVRRCTAEDDRLLYVGYQPEVFVLAGRGFAGGHMMFLNRFHSSPDEQALTVRRLMRQKVPFVLVPSAMRNDFRQVFDQVWGYVHEHYVPLTSIEMDDGQVDILIEATRRAGVSAHQTTGWPCVN